MTGRNRIGLISLAIAAVGFLFVTFQPWLPLRRLLVVGSLNLQALLSAFFDASLVGALADWFAVTALFRSPLGIRLPHTDILARNRDAIAEAVPRFLTSFVSEQSMARELASVDFAGKLAQFLSEPAVRSDTGELLRERLAALLAVAVNPDGGPTESLVTVVGEILAQAGHRIDPAAASGAVLTWVIREGLDTRLFRAVLAAARSAMAEHRDALVDWLTPVVRGNSGWRGLFVGRGTVERLLRGAQEELERIRDNPDHELRLLLDRELRRLAARLSGETPDPDPVRERIRASWRALAADPRTADRAARLLAAWLHRMQRSLQPEHRGFLQGVEQVEQLVVSRLRDHPEFRRAFNEGVAGMISGLLARGRLVQGASDYLAGVVKSIDVREFVHRVETAVWNDLQYIRVNGAVVGGMVGVVLAFLMSVLPR